MLSFFFVCFFVWQESFTGGAECFRLHHIRRYRLCGCALFSDAKIHQWGQVVTASFLHCKVLHQPPSLASSIEEPFFDQLFH